MTSRIKIATALMAVALAGAGCATQPSDRAGSSADGNMSGSPAPTSTPVAGATGSPMTGASPAGGTTASFNAMEREFVTKAAQGGKMEVQLGQLAAEKARSADVKQFAERMVADHSRASQDLMQVASRAGVTPPDELSAEGQQTYDRLSKLSGAAFDREYMSHMVEHHMKDVSEFEQASNTATNPDLKSLASGTLPTLREHLQMARELARKVGAK
jgi:putative membrane protein